MSESTLTKTQKARIIGQHIGTLCHVDAGEFPEHTLPVMGAIPESGKVLLGERSIQLVEVVDCRLLLKHLSEISDEDAIQVAIILRSPHAIYHLSDRKNMIESTKYWIEHGLIAVFSSNAVQNHLAYQYLKEKGYAVPLFIELGHSDNGMTAIELGIAYNISVVENLNENQK